jgi:hypothetical protein
VLGTRKGELVGAELYDCPWCGSAKSIDFGVCQVCLMEFPVETRVISLPTRSAAPIVLDAQETAKAE